MGIMEETGLPPNWGADPVWLDMGYVERGLWTLTFILWWILKITMIPVWGPLWGLGYLVSKRLPQWKPFWIETTPRHY